MNPFSLVYRQMTKEELKFALAVESFINTVSTPEYRQLLVEATTVLGSLVMHDEKALLQLNCIISLDDLVVNANHLFLKDQVGNPSAIFGGLSSLKFVPEFVSLNYKQSDSACRLTCRV